MRSFCRKNHVHKILVLGGGILGLGGGGECRFYFYGRADFSDIRSLLNDNKISDNNIRNISEFYCHGVSQEKQRFGTIFRKCSPSPTPSKTQILLMLSFRRRWVICNLRKLFLFPEVILRPLWQYFVKLKMAILKVIFNVGGYF